MPNGIDLRRAVRRIKPHKHARLVRRTDDDLGFADEEKPAGRPLLLDACVYIHALRGKTPVAVDRLLRTRTLFHSAVAVSELSYRIGARIPAGARVRAARKQLEAAIEDIPAHRLVHPGAATWCEAGILAGARARQAGSAIDQEGLNDALICLQGNLLARPC